MSATTGSYTPVQNINYGPQAKDDGAVSYENQFLLIDVLANDLGGNAKVLWSLQQVNHAIRTTDGNKVTLASGAQVWFENGKVAYDGRTSSAFDYLAAGESATDTFTYAIRMSTGVVSYATVTVTVRGTNDAPTIVGGDVSGAAVEDDTAPLLADAGSIPFQDLDLSNSHTVAVSAAQVTASSGIPAGFVPAGGFGALTADVVENTGDSNNLGRIDWSFAASNAAVQALAAGETVTQVYTLTVTDSSGASAAEKVTVTITGTNDGPTIVGGDTGGAVTEGAAASLADHGSIVFQDLDLSNTHTVAVSAPATTTSPKVPAGFVPAGGFGTLTATVVENPGDLGNHGRIDWSFTVSDSAVDGLAAGETVTQTYELTLTDSSNATVTETVTVVITGTNDGPAIVGGDTGGAVTEDASSSLTDSGSIEFEDLDLSNTHAVAVGAARIVASNGVPDGFVPAGGFGTLGAVVVEDATDLVNRGRIEWSFVVSDAAVQGLAAGETVTQTYELTLTDSSDATVTETVTVVITGTNDGPTIVGGDTGGAVIEDASSSLTDSGSIEFEDLDLSDAHGLSVSAPAVATAGGVLPGTVPAGGFGTLSAIVVEDVTDLGNRGRIEWSFAVDNAAVQGLAAGETVTQTYTLTLADLSGAEITENVVVVITGTNDIPAISSGPQSGAVDEKAEPGEGGTLSTAGLITFTDADLSDDPSASVTSRSVTEAALANGRTLNASQIQALQNAFSIDAAAPFSAGSGSVAWKYAIADSALDFLGAADSVTLTFEVVIADGNGGLADEDVVITVTGTNDAPVLTVAAAPELIRNGNFEDGAAFWSNSAGGVEVGGSSTYQVSPASGRVLELDRGTELPLDAVSQTVGTTAGGWYTFSFDAARRGLGTAESNTFGVYFNGVLIDTVTPASNVFQRYSYVVQSTGTTGKVEFRELSSDSVGPILDNVSLRAASNVVSERPAATGSAAPDVATASLSFTDVDLSDAHAVSVGAPAASWSRGSLASLDTATAAALDSALQSAVTLALADSTGTGAGTIGATFSAADSVFDFLAAGDRLTVTYNVTVTDSAGSSSVRPVSFTVLGTNDAPVAVADSAGAGENQAITVDVLANDTDVDSGAGRTLVSAAAPTGQGVASVVANKLVFTPGAAFDRLAAGATESVVVAYTMADEHGAQSSSTLTILVTGTNDGPVAVADSASGSENQTLMIDVVANDTDVDHGDTKTLFSLGPVYIDGELVPAAEVSAMFSIVGNQVKFVPGTAFDHLAVGSSADVSLAYRIADAAGEISQGALALIVTGTNDRPTVSDPVSGTAAEDGAASTLDALAHAHDVDDGAVLGVVSIGALPAGVTYDATAKSFTLDPAHASYQSLAAGQQKTVTVSYSVSDGIAAPVSTSLSWVLTGTNDAPTLTPGPNLSGAVSYYGGENNVRDSIGANHGSAAGVAFAAGHDGDAFSFSGSNYFTIANQIPANFTISGWIKTSAASLTGGQFYHGNGLVYADVGGLARDFGISILNNRLAFGTGGYSDITIQSTSNVATGDWVNFAAVRNGSVISIYINGVLEASVDTGYAGLLNSPASITVGANRVDGRYYNGLLDGLTVYDYAQSAAEIVQHWSLGTANILERTGTTGSAALDSATVSVVLNDVDLADVHTTSLSEPTLSVSGGGTAPVGLAAALSGAATTALTDSSGTGAGLVAVTFSAQDKLFDFLAAGQSLTITYTLTVSDGQGGTATQPVSYIVTGTSDAPTVAAAIADSSVAEDTVWTFQVPAGSFADVDSGTTLTYTAALAGGGALPSWLSFTAATGTFSGTPPVDFNGTISLEVTASDGSLSITDTFDVAVQPVNDAPTIASLDGDSSTQTENSSTFVFVDAGRNAVIADVDSGNFNGGSLTIKVTSGFNSGFDRIGIWQDGILAVGAGNVLSVNGVAIGVVSGGSCDFPYSDTFVIQFNTDDATVARVQTLLRGIFFSDSRAEPQSGSRTLSVTLVDGDGTSGFGADTATANVGVTVVAINDAPGGTDKTITMLEDGSRVLTAADFGFDDRASFGIPEGDSLKAVMISSLPGAGTLTLNGAAVSVGQLVSKADLDAGDLIYAPSLNGNGNAYAGFTFQVQDTGGTANGGIDLDPTANAITFNVTAVDDAPVLDVVKTETTYTENASGFAVDPTLLVTDPDGPSLGGAVVSISKNFVSGQDSLSFTSLYGITGSFNPGTGQLTLTGTATAAQYQQVLRTVTYANSSDNPSVADRTVTFAIVPNGTSAQYFATNGHFYQYVQTGLTAWTTAKAAAETSTLFGLKGYLATVTSSVENQFVIQNLKGNAWLGGADTGVEGQWRWVTGPEAGTLFYTGSAGSGSNAPGAFSYWQGGEPNNFGNEDYLQYFLNGWNDLPNAGAPGYIDGYLIEYGGMPGDAVLALSDSIVVKVQAVNDAPTNVALSPSSVPENSGAGAVVGNLTGTDVDSSAAQLTYSVVGGRSDLFAVNGSQLVVKAGAELDFEAVPSHDVLVRVTDQTGAFYQKTLTIAVADGNEAPIWNLTVNGDFERGPFVNNGHGWMSLPTGSTTIPGWTVTGSGGVDWHIAADTQGRLFLDLAGSGPGGVSQSLATVVGAVYRIDFDLAANPAYGSMETIRVTAAATDQSFSFDASGRSLDNMGWQAKSTTFTATSTVTAIGLQSASPNDSVGPALDNVKVTLVGFATNEDQALVSSVRGVDPDGDALTYTRTVDATNGNVVVNSNGTFTYTPNANFNGTDSFKVQASDGKGGVSEQTFTVDVAAVNDAPTLVAPGSIFAGTPATIFGGGYVDVTSPAAFTGTGAFSYEITFKTSTTGIHQNLLSIGYFATNKASQIGVSPEGYLAMGINGRHDAGPGAPTYVGFVADGSWHTASFTHNGAGTYTYYLDGKKVGAFFAPGVDLTNGVALIGSANTDYRNSFQGEISDAHIWTRELSAAEVANQSPPPANDPGLIGSYMFTSGSAANVASGMADGTIVGNVILGSSITAQLRELPDGIAGEGATTLTESGSILFKDVDAGQTHSASFTEGGSGYLGTFQTTVDQALDKVNWTFSAPDSALHVLAAGETRVQTYTVSISDGNGGTAAQQVTVTITGTNDAPVISGGLSAAVTEALPNGGFDDFESGEGGWLLSNNAAAPTATISPFGSFLGEFAGSGGAEQVSKTFALDPAQNLTRIAFDFIKLGTWDAQGVAGAASDERLFVYINGAAAFEITPEEWTNGGQPGLDNASGSFTVGALSGTFTVTSAGVDVNRYDTSVDWGGSRSYHVEVLLNGAGSSVKLGFGNNLDGGHGDETLGIDNVLVTHRLTDRGTISFADPDSSDTHGASFAAQGSGYLGSFALDGVDQAANGLGWGFFVDDSDISSLPGGQTIVQTYAVTVSDGKGGTDVENVAVTIVGRNDVPTIGGQASGTVHEDTITSVSGTLTISDADTGQASFQARSGVAGSYGTLNINSAGQWTYFLNNSHSSVQALTASQSLSDTVTVRAADGTAKAIGVTILGKDDSGFTGHAVRYQYLFSTTSSPLQGSHAETVGSQVEFSSADPIYTNGSFVVDVSATTVQITYVGPVSWSPGTFNGFKITDANGTVPSIVGVSDNSAKAAASFDANSVFVNWQNQSFASGESITVNVQFAGSGSGDPIVLDLDGDGIAFRSGDDAAAFDLDADGLGETIGWMAEGDGLLVLDLDGSGAIEDGREVVSEAFLGLGFGSSMDALRFLDSNLDGLLDARDDRFGEVGVWRDANGDGVTQAGELMSLTEAGIGSISVETGARDEQVDGQQILAVGEFTFATGAAGSFVAVNLSGAVPLPQVDFF